MGMKTTQLTVLLLLALAWSAAGQRRGIRTCSCQVGNGYSQQGKLVGRVCYVVGVGSCRSFAYEGPTPDYASRRFGSSRFGSSRFGSSRFGGRRDRYGIAEAAATATPEQQRDALEQTRRQLEERREQERYLSKAGVTVRPGSPEAALARERRPDAKSVALGNKALEQILYLQSLISGRKGRR